MSKTYAKYRVSVRRRQKRRQWYFAVIIFLVTIVMIGGIAYFLSKTKNSWLQSHIVMLKDHAHSFFKTKKISDASKSLEKTKVSSSSHVTPQIHFEFYDTLPNSAVTIDTSPLKKEISFSSQYIIQIGIYKNSRLASEAQVSLLLSGIDASIQKIKGQDNYCLQEGPYASFEEAKAMQRLLQNKGMMTVIKKIEKENVA